MAEHVCPWWLGYFLVNPLRKLIQDPVAILSPYVREGMTALDVGSAMGFFSLPLAKLVGSKGKVICVDLQEKMIASLKKRIVKAGFSEWMETRVCSKDSLKIEDLADSVDFALAFALVHEVPDQQGLFRQIGQALKPGHCLLVAEPSGHVNRAAFDRTINLAEKTGFEADGLISVKRSHASLLRKK